MRLIGMVLVLLLWGQASAATASPPACDAPLAEVAARFLPGKTADQAAEPGALPPCFHVARLEGAEAVIMKSVSGEAVIAWKTGRRWTLRPAELENLPPAGGHIAFPAGKADVFLHMETGSGRIGWLLHGREDARRDRIRFRPVTESTGKTEFAFVRHDLVLHTHSGGGELPLAWTSNAQLPANAQTLLRWDGERWEAIGRRTFPEPHLTANRFLGALQSGNMARAARYTAAPAIAEKARQLLGDGVHLWSDAEDTSQGSLKWVIREAEKHNWDLLPPDLRMTPPATYTFPLNLGRERVVLQMTRTPQDWIITDVVRKKPPGRLTSPGGFLRSSRGGGTGRAGPGSPPQTERLPTPRPD